MQNKEVKSIAFIFPEGEKILKMGIFSKTWVHHLNDHRLKAQNFSGPAPWLGNVSSGSNVKPFDFIQVYCKTCEEKLGITYLDKFDIVGNCTDEQLTEDQLRAEVDIINKAESTV